MNRYAAAVLAALLDVVVFCALYGRGMPLAASHIAAFAAAIILNYFLKVRPALLAQGRTRDASLHVLLLAVSLMALFLRGGILGLLVLTCGWPAQAAIVLAALAGAAVAAGGYTAALSPDAGGARTRALAVGIIVYAVLLRLVYLGSVELLPEETYYWNYSRHLDIGYLDHPPMVAWLIKLGTAVFGQSQFGVRIGALCCALVASLFVYRLARNLFGTASALAALVLAQVLPFFFLSGLLMTPDAPLTAAWAAALYYLERSLIAGRSRAWWGVGLALGFGAISKYTIGLLVPVTLLFMLWDQPSRRWWRSWQPYAAALVAAAVFSPVILWNAAHDWASFAFQTTRRLGEAPRFALHKLIAAVVILITPTGALALTAAYSGARAGTGPLATGDDAHGRRRRRFVALAILVPLSVFALFSLRHEVKLDWTGAPSLAALPVIAAVMAASRSTGFGAWVRRAWGPTLVLLLLIYGAGLHYLVLGLPGIGYSKHTELIPIGWRDLSRQVEGTAAAIREQTGTAPLIVGLDRYATASELAFYGTKRVDTVIETSSSNLFGGMGLMYERWTPARLQRGKTLLLVAWSPGELADKEIESHAERLDPIAEGTLTRDGHVVRHYYYRVAYNYRTPDPAETPQ